MKVYVVFADNRGDYYGKPQIVRIYCSESTAEAYAEQSMIEAKQNGYQVEYFVEEWEIQE